MLHAQNWNTQTSPLLRASVPPPNRGSAGRRLRIPVLPLDSRARAKGAGRRRGPEPGEHLGSCASTRES